MNNPISDFNMNKMHLQELEAKMSLGGSVKKAKRPFWGLNAGSFMTVVVLVVLASQFVI